MFTTQSDLNEVDEEQLPVPNHRQYRIGHFFGLYGAEHIAATEFVPGATLATLSASFNDVVFGLLLGDLMAVLSFWLITVAATGVTLHLNVPPQTNP